MTFSVDDLLDEAAASASASPSPSAGAHAPHGNEGPIGTVLSAFAALPGARVHADGRVTHRCIFHNDKRPSAVIFAHGAYHCSGCAVSLSFQRLLATPEAVETLGEDVVDAALAARRDSVTASPVRERRWPTPLGPAAYHGLLGRLVRLAEPHTESDPAAILLQSVVAIGNLLGRKVFIRVERTKHFLVLFLILVGATSKGRKGTSWDLLLDFFPFSAETWKEHRIMAGLSSGEGLIWAVRDHDVGDNEDEDDAPPPEPEDKRLLVMEPEWARVLRVLERDGNTLSAIIRQCYDSGQLRVMTRKSPVSASNVHVSLIGHVTADEFRKLFRDTEAANGFGNRFLLACVQRSKVLPFGGHLNLNDMLPVQAELDEVIQFVEALDPDDAEMHLGPDARELWASVYPELSEGKPGMVGALTARAEAHALRIAALYAVLDKTLVVGRNHLEAALEVVRYAEDSTRYVFGDASGDAVADDILAALQAHPNGMTRTELRDLFGRNRSGDDIGRALDLLQRAGAAKSVPVTTTGRSGGEPGRHPQCWVAVISPERPTTETTNTTEAPLHAAAEPPSVVNVVPVVGCAFGGNGVVR